MKQYRALESDLANTQVQLEERGKRVSDLEGEVSGLQADVSRLESEIGKLQVSLESKQGDLDGALGKQAELLADKGKLAEDVESMRQALSELQARRDAAEARLAAYRDLLSRFRKLIDAGKLKVKIVDGRMVVELATDVLFASGSAVLSKEGKASIEEVAGVLASIPDRGFQVEGHTDDDPIHTEQYPSNWELAAGRALTVVKTMVEAGMPAERISAASLAEFRPVASNETKEGKAANRRIEIVVVPDLSGLPGYDELQQVGASEGTKPTKKRQRPRKGGGAKRR